MAAICAIFAVLSLVLGFTDTAIACLCVGLAFSKES